MTYTVRAPRADEMEGLRDIERAAGRLFAEIGMHDIAADEPDSAANLEAYRAAGRAWVVADDSASPVAYLIVDVVDGCAHIEQVSVHPDHARQSLGRRLIDHVAEWAAARGLAALTLTTFRDVAWNAPYYERCGFRTLAAGEVTPGLAAIGREEAEHGLDPAARVFMRREIQG